MIVQTGMSEYLREEIREAYLEGLSIWNVARMFPQVSQRELREALEGIVRSRNLQRTADPSEEELVARREEIKASWSDEVASRRWVGRYVLQKHDQGSCLSALLRSMGGEG